MPPQRRRRTRFHDRPFERRPHRRALMRPVDKYQGARHPQKKRHRQRQRARRHILETRKRSVVHLLHAADVVQFHWPHVTGILEIAHRRIDKRQVPVLSNSHGHQVRFHFRQ